MAMPPAEPASSTSTSEQRGQRRQLFAFGYEIITWDLEGAPLGPVLDFLQGLGFQWYEALLGDSLGRDYSRRVMTLGDIDPPSLVTDMEIFDRLAFFGAAKERHAIALASLFADGELAQPACLAS